MAKKKTYKCKLCGNYFPYEEMSEEHYPARSVGNNDIVAVNIAKFTDEEIRNEIFQRLEKGEKLQDISDDIFDKKLSKSLYRREENLNGGD